MAGNIKGITIEFRGDTTKLDKALRQIKSEGKELDSELKQINRALKFNPTNAELLKQKFNVLGKEVDRTEDQIKQLKAAEKQLNAQGVSKQSAEWQKVRREIIQAESKLKHYNAEMAKIKYAKLTAMGNAMSQAGQKMRTFSAAAGLLGGIGVSIGMEFDTAMSKVQAISGATGEDFEALRLKAREMGAATKFSATESAEALNYMAMAGWDSQQMMDGLPGVLNLAAASGEDLAKTSDIVTDGLTAMGYGAEDAGRLADVMAAASSSANTNVSMMGETFKYAAPVAGTLGYSMEDVALATGLMANSGIKASQAGTSLRSMLSRMASPTDAVAAAMDKVGVSLTDSQGNMKSFRDVMGELRSGMKGMSETEQAQVASSIAGKNAMSGFLAIINSSDKDFEKLANSIDNSNGAAEQMADTMMQNFGGQMTILKSQLSELAISVSDTLTPAISWLVGIVQKLVGWFNSLSETQKQVVVAIAGIAAAAGPVMMVMGAVFGAIGRVIGAFRMVWNVIKVVRVAFLALSGPIGIVIAAIAAAIAIGVALYTHWDEVKAFILKTWNAIKSGATRVWNAIKNAIAAPMQAAQIRLRFLLARMRMIFINTVNGIKAKVSAIFNAIKTAITHPIQTAANVIRGIVNKIKGFFSFSVPSPHIPLPHFKVSPAGWKVGDLLKGKIPHLSVDWYAKGGIFNSPSVIGVGEDGTEAVVPLDKFWKKLDNLNGGEFNLTININDTNGMDAKQIAAEVERRIIQSVKRQKLAWA